MQQKVVSFWKIKDLSDVNLKAHVMTKTSDWACEKDMILFEES